VCLKVDVPPGVTLFGILILLGATTGLPFSHSNFTVFLKLPLKGLCKFQRNFFFNSACCALDFSD